MIKILNPYPKKPNVEMHRINCDISEEDHTFLLHVFPGHGNMQAVTGTLIKQLIDDLKTAKINIYTYINETDILSILNGRRSAVTSPEAITGKPVKRRARNSGSANPKDSSQPKQPKKGGGKSKKANKEKNNESKH